MRQITLLLILLFNFSCIHSQESNIDPVEIKEDLNAILNSISYNYVYLQEKNVDLRF